MNRYKRIISVILLCIMLSSYGAIDVHANQATLPGSNPTGPGNLGPYHAPAVMVKADFYSPSQYGITNENYIDRPQFKDNKESGIGPFESVNDRTIFERGMKRPTMPAIAPGLGGVDSKEVAQMYAYKGYGYKTVSFLDAKDRYTTFDSTGHKYISPDKMSGVNGSSYRTSNGILSVGNVYMKALLEATKNGTEWDGEKVANTLNKLWNEHVAPSGNFGASSPGVQYRQQFASMFDYFGGTSNLAPAMDYVHTVYEEHLKVGSTPPGASFKIESEMQKSYIQNLMTASIGLVLANPAGGTTISPEGYISPTTSYKGESIKKGLETWARAGGNSDDSDNHFAIRLELYASRGLSRGNNQFDRWDYALHNATTSSRVDMISVPANVPLGLSNPDYYGYDSTYSLAKAGKYFTEHLESILDGHRIEYGLYPKKDPRDSATTGWNWTSMFTIFQEVSLGANGSIRQKRPGGSEYNYRGILEFKTPGYFNSERTVQLGFGYIAPSGANEGPDGETMKPNPHMDATAFTDEQMLPKGTKGKVTSYNDFKFPTPPSESEIKQYNLKVPDNSWNQNTNEVNNLLKLIERASDSSQISGGSDKKQLPVTLTIKRSIVNGKGNTDGKIIDNMIDTQVQKCGKHNFTIASDNGATAVIKFNLIPSGGQCTYGTKFKVQSPIKVAEGKSGEEAYVEYDNCAIATLFKTAENRIKFNDDNIEITDTPGGVTTVNYDYSYIIEAPTFKINDKVYGPADKDTMANNSKYTGLGHSNLPIGGAVYPNSDWNSGFVRSGVIRRSVVFTRAAEQPYYTNIGYEKKTPYFSEIKQGGPTNEPFEAMSGTPTTRDLYMSVSATDFRVDFNANAVAKANPNSYRKYTYTVNVSNCWETNPPCTGSCPGPLYDDEGNETHEKHSPLECGIDSCASHPTNEYHPDSHTWVYNVHVPIEAFTYFDMEDSEVWRLIDWGLNGGTPFLTRPNPKWEMGTQFWGLNVQNYASKNGRIIFSDIMNDNESTSFEKYGDNSRTFEVSDNLRDVLKQEALDLVNGAKNSEPTFGGTIVSDYIVLKTSEGYQVPYFHEQPFDTTAAPSSAPDFSGEGGTSTTTDTLKVNKQLTIDDLWWKNGKKTQAATRENGWTNDSITYAGYNGDYANLGSKYINEAHVPFLSDNNPLADTLEKYDLSIGSAYPNQKKDGSGNTSFGKNAGNTEHIKTGLDIIDTTPNGEYDTGKSWLRYDRVMFYQKNSDRGEKSGTAGKFQMTGPGVYRNENVPYYTGARKVNDIVIHNPVSTQDSVVITNDKKYDDRTNAELMQGGDPVGLKGGVCPIVGCQYSTLICDTPLEAHKDSCYAQVTDKTIHIGGNNSHQHTADCTHRHTSSCYPAVTKNYWYHNDSGCTYAYERHVSTSSTSCSECGHSCGYYEGSSSGGGVGGWICDDQACMRTGSHNSSLCPYNHSCSGCNECHVCVANGDTKPSNPICGKQENTCTRVPNTHVCQVCDVTYKKVLSCNDPHHYAPGEPTDRNNPKYHHPIGDPRCWERCGDDAKHGEPDNITLPNGSSAKMGGVFINIDREFEIYYPFIGDFAEEPSLEGIPETTVVRGKGYYNRMDTEEWTSHRWVSFPVNVIDPKGEMRLATSQIDLNEFSTTEEYFTFYSVLANQEQAGGDVKFTSTAINLPGVDHNTYYDESVGITNKERVDWKYAARHTAAKHQYIDVVGYIGALTLHDTGDFRFSNLFKQSKGDGTYLIPNLVPEVHLNRPNYILGDNVTVRRDPMTKSNSWLDTYGKMFNKEGGKSGGEGNEKEPLLLPLVPRYNNIAPLRNQPMRPGYQLYMDTETAGNYYGETLDEETGLFLDSQMQAKMQIVPKYYSLDLITGKYTPVDVYYGINGDYMQVNSYDFGSTDNDEVGVKDYYYYLDWLEESARRNYSSAERESTEEAKNYRSGERYGDPNFKLRSPNAERDVVGSANVLFLNDLNRTFIGSSSTYGEYKNPGEKLEESYFNEQSQRWHFTLGLPSSSVFVERNKDCTEANIEALISKDRVIVCNIDIKVQGDVWTLQYDGSSINNNGYQIFEGGKVYEPPKFDENGNPTTDPKKDVTSNNPIIVIYPPEKTSKDDVRTHGIQ